MYFPLRFVNKRIPRPTAAWFSSEKANLPTHTTLTAQLLSPLPRKDIPQPQQHLPMFFLKLCIFLTLLVILGS
jgi:hypothetical protein